MKISELKRRAVSVEEKNTNNDWGFGGWAGKVYTMPNGEVARIGHLYYRHAPKSQHRTYLNAEGEEITAKEFELKSRLTNQITK